MSTEECCKNCKFVRFSTLIEKHECHRHAPIPAASLEFTWEGDENHRMADWEAMVLDHGLTWWPSVKEDDWCGEFVLGVGDGG